VALISSNRLEIVLDELVCGDLFGPDRTMHVGNCRFLEVEPRRKGSFRHQREVRGVEHRRTDAEHDDFRPKASRTHGTLSQILGMVCSWYSESIRSAFATDRCAMKISPCPLCPERDDWPSRCRPSRWATRAAKKSSRISFA